MVHNVGYGDGYERFVVKILMIVCLAWFLVGCQVLGPYWEQPRISQRQADKMPSKTKVNRQQATDYQLPTQKGTADDQPQNGSAVEYLLDVASQQMDKGQWLIASATIERALRIDPRSTEAYLYLADLRLQQRRFTEAEQLARKALLYISTSQNAHKLKTREAALWRIIEDAQMGVNNEAETKVFRTHGHE